MRCPHKRCTISVPPSQGCWEDYMSQSMQSASNGAWHVVSSQESSTTVSVWLCRRPRAPPLSTGLCSISYLKLLAFTPSPNPYLSISSCVNKGSQHAFSCPGGPQAGHRHDHNESGCLPSIGLDGGDHLHTCLVWGDAGSRSQEEG